MADHTYKIIEVVGTSTDSIQDAVRNAVLEAGKTLRGLEWFEVGDVRGHIEDGQVAHFQVPVRIGFRLES